MNKTYKLTLTLNAKMNEESFDFYRKNMADGADSLFLAEEHKFTIEPTDEKPDVDWTNE